MESFEIKSNTNVLGKALKEVLSIASKYDIEIFLNYGALLGFEREGRLLPWNNDVELGLKLEKHRLSQIREFTDDLNLAGFKILFHQYCGTISISKKDVDININFYWKTDKYWVRPHDTAVKARTSNWLANKVYWISALFLIKNLGSVWRKHNLNFKGIMTIVIGKLPYWLKLQLYTAGTHLSNILGGRQSLTAIPRLLSLLNF
jgi:phosphorylcholine metabolism protein LicD